MGLNLFLATTVKILVIVGMVGVGVYYIVIGYLLLKDKIEDFKKKEKKWNDVHFLIVDVVKDVMRFTKQQVNIVKFAETVIKILWW